MKVEFKESEKVALFLMAVAAVVILLLHLLYSTSYQEKRVDFSSRPEISPENLAAITVRESLRENP